MISNTTPPIYSLTLSSVIISLILSFVSLQLSSSRVSAQAGALKPPQLTTRFKARSVRWDARAQTLHAREQVRLTQGELGVTCASAMIEFEDAENIEHVKREGDDQSPQQATVSSSQNSSQNTPQSAPLPPLSSPPLHSLKLKHIRAQGSVKVRFRDLSLSAAAIDYDHAHKTLEVTGPISGRWGQARLRGAHMTISLATRATQVEEVEVRLPLPALIPRSVRELNSSDPIEAWRSR